MKKLGLFMMFAAALTLGACNNLNDDWDPNGGEDNGDNGGNNTEQVDPAGSGTEEDPYNVAKALTVQDGSMAWVKGYIVGFMQTGDSNYPVFSAETDTINTNILLADSIGDEENYIAVQ